MAGLIDVEAETQRLEKEIAATEGRLKGVLGKLNNESFVSRAPDAVVAKENEKKATYENTLEKLRENLKEIQAMG